MGKFNVDISADPEIPGDRRIIIRFFTVDYVGHRLVVNYTTRYKDSGGEADLKVSAYFPVRELIIANQTRITSSGEQFLEDNSRNPDFAVRVPFPLDPEDTGAADTQAWEAAIKEYDFIESKMEADIITGKIGIFNLLDYIGMRIEELDLQEFFNK